MAGPRQSVDEPLCAGGRAPHEWAFATRTFRAMHGMEGGETGVVDDVATTTEGVGAPIMGRNMFGGGPGPWDEDPRPGWWGQEPPVRAPVFVLIHHARPPLALRGGTTFHFVTGAGRGARARAPGRGPWRRRPRGRRPTAAAAVHHRIIRADGS